MNEEIERAVTEYNERVYHGEMTAHQKDVLRDVLSKELKFWTKEARDYTPADEGEEKEVLSDY